MNMHIYDESTRELALSSGEIMMIPAEWLDDDDPVTSVRTHANHAGLIEDNDLFVSIQ